MLLKILIALFNMVWDLYWGLAFGFILSSLIRAFVATETISSRLGRNNVAAVGLSAFFGAISSSCSYAAASMARTLLIKGSTWSNAVVFMVSSTNLVFEIFIVIVSLLGWSFFGGEVMGGVFFIVISAALIAFFYPDKIKKDAKTHLEKSEDNKDEHMHKDTADRAPKVLKDKLFAASGYFYMDVAMVGKDISIGVVVASILMTVVPQHFWSTVFLSDNKELPHVVILLWNVVMGVFIAIISFVCSVGNIVMAAVFWHGGISFGGVIAYIIADLVTIPMLAVYRNYYGNKTMLALLLFLTVSIIISALLVDVSFSALGWMPHQVHGPGMPANYIMFTWNYKTVLNLIFIPLSMVYFFIGKKEMAKMM